MIEVRDTDKYYTESPVAGHEHCKCSRCRAAIPEAQGPIVRVWTANAQGEIDKDSLEYVYCDSCCADMGLHRIPALPWDDVSPFDPERACRQCGCTENKACFHPSIGPCWWEEVDLCSHCKLGYNGNSAVGVN